MTNEKIRPRSFTSLISREIREVVVVQWTQKKISKKCGACADLLLLFLFVCCFFFLKPIELIFDVTLPPSSSWLSELPNIT